MARAARQGLKAECAGSGEKIEYTRIAQRVVVAVGEDVEQGLPQPVRAWPDVVGARRGEAPAAKLTANPFEAVTTVTVQIVTLLVGDQEFDSPKTLAAFALGLVLFFVTLALNVLALYIVRKYREQYE